MTPEQIELHRQVLKQIKHEPERWRQQAWVTNAAFYPPEDATNEEALDWYDRWFDGDQGETIKVTSQSCDTAFCYAGWALAITNPEYTFTEASVFLGEEYVGNIETEASKVLGLNSEQANYLFDSDNTLPNIEEALEHFGIDIKE